MVNSWHYQVLGEVPFSQKIHWVSIFVRFRSLKDWSDPGMAMVYCNQYGCRECGLDGVILPPLIIINSAIQPSADNCPDFNVSLIWTTKIWMVNLKKLQVKFVCKMSCPPVNCASLGSYNMCRQRPVFTSAISVIVGRVVFKGISSVFSFIPVIPIFQFYMWCFW